MELRPFTIFYVEVEIPSQRDAFLKLSLNNAMLLMTFDGESTQIRTNSQPDAPALTFPTCLKHFHLELRRHQDGISVRLQKLGVLWLSDEGVEAKVNVEIAAEKLAARITTTTIQSIHLGNPIPANCSSCWQQLEQRARVLCVFLGTAQDVLETRCDNELLLQEVHELFNEGNIIYTAIGGTAIALYRNLTRVHPFDDDCDLQVVKYNKSAVAKLLEGHPVFDYYKKSSWKKESFYTLRYRDKSRPGNCDVFYKSGPGKFRSAEILARQPTKFMDGELYMPSNVEWQFEQFYGEAVFSLVQIWNHQLNSHYSRGSRDSKYELPVHVFKAILRLPEVQHLLRCPWEGNAERLQNQGQGTAVGH